MGPIHYLPTPQQDREFIDVALVGPIPEMPSCCQYPTHIPLRLISPGQHLINQDISILGATSGLSQSRINGHSADFCLGITSWAKVKIMNTYWANRYTESGDSGALVIHHQNKMPLGIHIAVLYETKSVFIPLDQILTALDLNVECVIGKDEIMD